MSSCIICLESNANHTLCNICNYRYHTQCLISYIRSTNLVTCPTCRTELEVKDQPFTQLDTIINIYINDTDSLMSEENELASYHRLIGPFTIEQYRLLNTIRSKINIYNNYISNLLLIKVIITQLTILLTIMSYILLLIHTDENMLIVVYCNTILYVIIHIPRMFVSKCLLITIGFVEIILSSTLIAMSIISNNMIIVAICLAKLAMHMAMPVIFNNYHRVYLNQLHNLV